MKIQPISNNNYNQNNIASKASFKKNKAFNQLCDYTVKQISENSINKFKNLPNHEIEILSARKEQFSSGKLVDLFNHTTKKQETLHITDNEVLPSIIDKLCELTPTTVWFFTKDDAHIDIYDKLTQ
ncbi:MAG: hypothetical protein E7Z89_06230 [Cyanobacteria bacterium SIG28]|nr:hypothetical protein [Cyanobacteria bacterium SIG28]